MIKALANMWAVVCFMWTYVRPIYVYLMRIIKEAKEKGLTDDAARKHVFQEVTDFIQARGLKAIPDSVLNCSIELGYQIFIWRKGKA
jgi:hypothetical protein